MKALVYKGPHKVQVEEVPIPKVGKSEVLVKVLASGICGSDMHGYLGETGRRKEGYVMGHEFCGIVSETGMNVNNWRIGDRVVVQPSLFCSECIYCREGRSHLCLEKKFLGVFDINGAMAEYIVVPSIQLFAMPSDMTVLEGALIEPLAVARTAVNKIPFELKGKDVLVVGAGTIGLMLISVLKFLKAANIIVTDLSDYRLNIAKAIGADYIVNPLKVDAVSTIKDLTEGLGAHVSFEAVGSDVPVNTAIESLRLGGNCVWVGNMKKEIVINMQSVVTREITIYGTYTYAHKEFGNTIHEFSRMGIQADKIISKQVPIEEAPEIFEYISAGNDNLIKVLITF